MRCETIPRAVKIVLLGVLAAIGVLGVSVIIPDSTTASCFIDVVIIGLFLVPYYGGKPVCEKSFSEVAFAFCLIGIVLFWTVVQQTGLFLQEIIRDPLTDAYVGSGNKDSVMYLLLALVLAPFMEELLFRDRVYRVFMYFMPSGWACVFASILFGLVHGTVIHLYLGTMMGLFFSCVYRITGQLWLCVTMHSLFNLMSLWMHPGNPAGDVMWVVILVILNIFILMTLAASWAISRENNPILRMKFDIL